MYLRRVRAEWKTQWGIDFKDVLYQGQTGCMLSAFLFKSRVNGAESNLVQGPMTCSMGDHVTILAEQH